MTQKSQVRRPQRTKATPLPPRALRRAFRSVVAVSVVGGAVFLFVLPAREWMSQSRALGVAQRQDALLAQQDAHLASQVARLSKPGYIEQMARQELGLVMPGERAYVVLPPPPTSTTVAGRAQKSP